ncbi:uncharacterized protein SPSK_04151 [Sporothrix schenckii 1099-18]|uniref:Uncharacterized protein n=1 Tax=Sporothrix schenckii 1099-18 TaxID=1397361 RepID=A0A0F2LZS0_SPOSC|nr:uncharacterized protein SPSK_04151 [Sporothrix schenckii 1099-18]KJR82937.1 hypothetical protein SPSK_04151 [Sporothrix schenckii 1099-18]
MQPPRPLRPLRPHRPRRPPLRHTEWPDNLSTTPCTYAHIRPPTARSFSTTPKADLPRIAPGTIIPRPPPRVSPRVQRPEWQMRPGTPLYELPVSVLDLDAEDNPHVRPYDEAVDGRREAEKWAKAHASIDALSARLAQTEQQIRAAQLRMQVMEQQRTPWQVLDKDVWAAVLGVRDPGHGNVLHHNGISARLAATPQKVPLLLHRALAAREKKDGVATTAEQLSKALQLCRTPMELRRVVSLAVQTPSGRAITRQCSTAIAQRLASFVETRTWRKHKDALDDRDTARQVTAMLLNWSHALAEGGAAAAAATSSMWAVGLWTAALVGQPMAMLRFLQAGLGSGTDADKARFLETWPSQESKDAGSWPAAALALQALLGALRSKVAASALEGTRAELFSLLTGVHLLRPAADAGPDVSFRVLLSELPPQVPYSHLYVATLAELGGVRTLWEQQQKTGTAVGADTLVTAVVRYAVYAEAQAPMPTPSATSSLDRSAANSSVWDLQTIVNYEAARATARQPPTLFPTLRPVPPPLGEPETAAQPAVTVDDAFRDAVVAAFSQESADAAVQAIDALLQARQDGQRGSRAGGAVPEKAQA